LVAETQVEDSAFETDEMGLIDEIQISSELGTDTIEVTEVSATESSGIDFGGFELEEIELDAHKEEEADLYTPATDEELADILEMNSESSIIEFASEMMLEEDSVLDLSNEELGGVLSAPLDADAAQEQIIESIAENSSKIESDNEFDDQDSDLEARNVAYSLINNPETREVFVQEAHINLNLIAEELDKEEVAFGGDKVLSIAIHTLLGNSRTLGMTDIAAAYLSAENLCQAKSENGSVITPDERAALRKLLDQSRNGFENPLEEHPFYQWNLIEFARIRESLDAVAQTELETQILANSQTAVDIDMTTDLIELDEDLTSDFEALNDEEGLDLEMADSLNDDIVDLDSVDEPFELEVGNEMMLMNLILKKHRKAMQTVLLRYLMV